MKDFQKKIGVDDKSNFEKQWSSCCSIGKTVCYVAPKNELKSNGKTVMLSVATIFIALLAATTLG